MINNSLDLMADDLYDEGCYWVVPGRLLAGSHPAPGSTFGSELKLRILARVGVTCFFDLTTDAESPSYEALANSIVASDQSGPVAYVRQPLTEHRVPAKQEMQCILNNIDQHLTNADCVFIHCEYGVGRTGMVVGCWLVRHGLSNRDNVLEYIERLRAPLNSPWKSPNVVSQRKWTRMWSLDS